MNPTHILVAAPTAPQQLFLIFHGLGDRAASFVPMAEYLAAHFPAAAVVCIDSPYPCDFSDGFQWYSIQGVTEANRAERTQAVLPVFVQIVKQWQAHFGIAPEATCLLGFSQGAFMALESTQQPEFLAGRIVALAGRFCQPPVVPQHPVVMHLIHGEADTVVPCTHTVDAAAQLKAQGADITADVLADVAHEVPQEMAELLLLRLTTYVPQRLWQEALAASGTQGAGTAATE